ncbi:MAG: thioredoxin fold domain-containing protein [Gammaproteobacteria bacterium]|nr:thioredoxin fold domain-containing protein [Gammaproteobacteria bacterium]NIR96552.1 thioredoxin fold domain-containing protein [Gammaproteobacteria bacterium]NIT62290.1 thioredoxin fold domain-containing protein [Gammaproteobacteria bacterium]NIV19194.1 thioredoxin fold domain-containing protein [Gammaproteobacteria bacterium]NIX10062.1 thioredoxin fold domain-containing protein [Gammaproteobacteria bacterium]
MKRAVLSLPIAGLLAILAPGAHAADAGGQLAEGMVNPGYHEQPEWFKLSFLDLREDVAEAKANGKRVLLYFYQDGCPYCAKLLEDNFGQRAIAEKTRENFDVIAINMWGSREVAGLDGEQTTEKEFAAAMRVMFTPTLLFLNEQGNPILRINGYYFPSKFDAVLDYVANKMERELTFNEYFQKEAPQPATGKLHHEPYFLQPPYDLAAQLRANGKPLLVFFEQKRCKPCDELHQDILQRERTRAEIEHFDVVLLDRWAGTPVVTPSGKEITARKWAEELGVKFSPSMVFFDAGGEEVFRTEAYLKAFHVQGAMAYARSGAYEEQPSFQRFLQDYREEREKQGEDVDLWK